MDVTPENRRIFEDARNHLHSVELKNFELFDRAILTLASAGLGISFTFLNNFIQFSSANCILLLKLSWLAFTVAICSTVISYLIGAKQISVEREYIYKYYIEGNENYANKVSGWAWATYYVNRISAISFIGAVVFLVSFVWLNI